MIRFSRFLSIFPLILSFVVVPSDAETAWLAAVPKASRAALARRAGAVDTLVRILKEDYDQARTEEASYARQARRAASSATFSADDLYDQRRLRWESARDIAQGRYGRTGASGFVTAAEHETRLASEGAAFRQAVKSQIPRFKAAALNDFIADAENRMARLPSCPVAAFAELRGAAASLKDADRRRWAEALAAARPEELALPFSERLEAYRTAPAGTDKFFAALLRFQDALAVRELFADALPSAAAAAWFVDRDTGRSAEFPAAAAASMASVFRTLADADEAAASRALRECPETSSALAETLSVSWLSFRRDPVAFSVSLALDQGIVKRALERAWRVARADDPVAEPLPADPAALSAAVNAAEAAAAALGASSPEEALRAFAAFRSSGAAFGLFAASARYDAEKSRVAGAFIDALSAAEAAAAAETGRPLVRVEPSLPIDPFALAALSYREERQGDLFKYAPVAPEAAAPRIALRLARDLGWSGGDAAAAAAWLGDRGIAFTIPFVAAGGSLDAEQAALLEAGTAFYPAGRPTAARTAVLRDRLARTAAAAGIPLFFAESAAPAERTLVILASLAAGAADSAKKSGMPLRRNVRWSSSRPSPPPITRTGPVRTPIPGSRSDESLQVPPVHPSCRRLRHPLRGLRRRRQAPRSSGRSLCRTGYPRSGGQLLRRILRTFRARRRFCFLPG